MINEKCSYCKEKKTEGVDANEVSTCLDCLKYAVTCEHTPHTCFIAVYHPGEKINQYICVRCFFKGMLGFN